MFTSLPVNVHIDPHPYEGLGIASSSTTVAMSIHHEGQAPEVVNALV